MHFATIQQFGGARERAHRVRHCLDVQEDRGEIHVYLRRHHFALTEQAATNHDVRRSIPFGADPLTAAATEHDARVLIERTKFAEDLTQQRRAAFASHRNAGG
ncbi:MAG TPA: hypothetical protein EYP98_14970 [Planctomycetes bacterium]|nr:hypothetical protein [Planctomycetota bacterium]